MQGKKISRIKYLYGLYLSRAFNYPFIMPKTITLTLTSRCNLRCIMCDHWRNKNIEELSSDEWKRIIDQLERMKIKEVDVSGGEPFVRKDIWEILEYLASKKISVNITTNFTLLTEEDIKRLFETSVSRLQISLDGIEETHDVIRGQKNTFNRVIKNIELFRKEREEKKSKIQLNATTVIMRNNLDKLIDIYNFTKKSGFTSITYQPVVDSNLDLTRRDAIHPLKIPKERLTEMDRVIEKLIEIRKKDHFIGNSIRHLEDIKKYFRNEKLDNVKCYSGFVLGIISPNGEVWSCMGNFADLKKQSIKDAWFSKRAYKNRILIKKCKNPCLYPCYLETDANNLLKATIKIFEKKP
jgi:MoaA/NifB/PqqE/SkfB family radical SAM enzyme